MNNICGKDRCCACGACVNICPKSAIRMEENEYGVKYPIINQELCINCNMCKKVCPQINYIDRNNVLTCYAANRKNQAKRLDSASGGIASFLYEEFLKNKKNGIIFGVKFDDKNHAIFKKTSKIEDIEKFKGSKYVQAEVGTLYTDIIEALKADMEVLVVGTPCQIDAINSILRLKKISTEKLLTVDLICHGVSPSKYLDENINYIKNKHKMTDVKKITFRSNRKYRNFHLCIDAINKNGKKKGYNRFSSEDPYFYAFLKGISLRENCYNCQYSNTRRVSDITIGDFIGLGKHTEFPKFDGNPENVSIILCNSLKGEKFIKEVKNGITLTKRSIEEALVEGTSLKMPFPKHKLREQFLENYKKYGFVETMYKIAGQDLNAIEKKEKLLRPAKIWIANIMDRKKEKHEQ